MKKKDLRTIKNAATAAFNKILSYVTETSTFDDGTDDGQLFNNRVCGILISSEENREWSHTVKTRFTSEFGSVYRDLPIDIETIYLTGSELLMQSTLLSHPAISGDDKGCFSFIITPGYTEAQLINELRETLRLTMVQVFCVQGPKTDPVAKPKCGIAGVYNTPMAPLFYTNGLQFLIPNIKKVCLAFTPHIEQDQERKFLEQHRLLIKKVFKELNIEVVEHLWSFDYAYENDLREHLKTSQVFITLDEPAVTKHRKIISKACDDAGVLFCSSDMDSLMSGAAGLGCGVTKDAYIPVMIKQLHSLMTHWEYVPSYQLPMQDGMRFNEKTLRRQGVKLSDLVLAALKMKSAFDESAITIMGGE